MVTARASASGEPPVELSDTQERPISPLVGCDVVSLDFSFIPVFIGGNLSFSLVVSLPTSLTVYESPTWTLTATTGGVNFYTKTITRNFSDGEPLVLPRDFKYTAENFLNNPAHVSIDFTEIPVPGNVALSNPPNQNALLDRSLNNLVFSAGSFNGLRITGTDFSSNYPTYTPCAQNSLDKELLVAGNFIVNTPLCIDQAQDGIQRFKIFLGDDSKITVAAGGSLSLLNVDVVTCRDYLADGIIVSGGTLSATTSTFSGCKNGIRVNNFSSAAITSCDFFDNQKGINLSGTTNVPMASRPLVTFSGTNRFFTSVVGGTESTVKKALTSPQTNYTRMEHGIYASVVQPFTLTGAAFTRVAKGIDATRTDMTINGTTFINIHPNENYAKGVAVTSTQANFLHYNGTGAVPVAGATFSDMYIGVVASFLGDLNIKNIEMMNQTTTGILATRLQNPLVHIADNWMRVRKFGIMYRQNQPTMANGFIANNNIRVLEGAVEGACIPLEGGSSTYANDKIWLEGNNLIMTDARYGIKSLSSDNTIISNNTVSITNSNQQNRTCIHLAGSDNTNVDCNLMTRNDGGNNNDFETTVGLYSTGSANSTISCNNSDDLLTGMQFFDMASNSHVQGNHFGNHYSGLVLGLPGNGDAFIGQQFDPLTNDGNGNVWDNFEDGLPNTNGVLGAFHYSPSQQVWNKSTFRVNNVANPAFLPENTQAAWFPTNQKAAFSCSNVSCPQGIPNDDKMGELEHDIADGRLTPLGLDEGIIGKANLQLYRLLSANPSFISTYSGYSGFMSNHANTTVGAFYQVEQGIQQLWALTASEKSYLNSNRGNLKQALEEIATASGASALATLQAQARTSSENLQSVADQKSGQQASAISYLMAFNASIPASKLWEQNLQSANALYLTMLVGNSYTQSDSVALFNIANQCPTVGGDGVYIARSLYALLNDSQQFDDENLCNGLGLRESKQNKSTEQVGLTVWPNPAMEKFQLKGLSAEPFHYVLTNSLGVVVDQGDKTDGWFDIGTFTSGLYVLTVSQGDITRSVKFVVAR